MKSTLFKAINLAIYSFSKKEKNTLLIAAVIFIVSSGILIWKYIDNNSVVVPSLGGNLTEGVIGIPKFINPLLAVTDADRDLTALIYSGLLRVGPDGEYIPDIADSYEISADGLSYTFRIRKNATWHDGKPVTSDDVEFTIDRARDPNLKSPKRAGLEGVIVEKIDNKTVKLSLKQRYSSFLENVLLGILPKHIWENVDETAFSYNENNLSPIGSGPYKISKIQIKSGAGGVPDYYDLIPFRNFTLGQPKIANIRIRFYQNETALLGAFANGEIEAINSVPAENVFKLTEEGKKILHTVLPRVFAVFLNQGHSKALKDASVRQALNLSLNKQEIVNKVLFGYGVKLDGPIPKTISTDTATSTVNMEQAKSILKKGGWKFNSKKSQWEKGSGKNLITLSFTIATTDVPELKQAASLIQADWQKLGAKVTLQTYNISDLSQKVIRPRQYDALFFGEVIGRDPDLFSFWHSSQRNDPGSNISMYANVKVDKILESARGETDLDKKMNDYTELEKEIAKDNPAIFIYAPYFNYAVPTKIQNMELPTINVPSDRFFGAYNWYITTTKVWKIFLRDTNN
ncbi:MAG: hypothetical protein HZA94_03575 [Candidatus Vogelbacteria bacterium]|nr:hypothetical protein [Candidatus Vogelbacteria bacterium]